MATSLDSQDFTATADSPRADRSPVRSLRKSCHFCRSRKIRCSGHSICSACQERNLDCVYGREGAKGRPKLNTSKASSTRGIPSKAKSKSTVPARTRESSIPGPINESVSQTYSPSALNSSYSWDCLFDAKQSLSIADELSHIFSRLFDPQSQQESQQFDNTRKGSDAVDAFCRRPSAGSPQQLQASGFGQAFEYDQPMTVMIEDLVELVAIRFGDLSCCQSNEQTPPTRMFQDVLAHDCSRTMFDDEVDPAPIKPLLAFSNYQTLQMIDVWFSHHPLAFLLSKTLLVQSYRNGTFDEILLAVVLGDVCLAQPNEEARNRGKDLFRWASTQLHNVSLTTPQDLDLALMQSLILLGWYEMCAGRGRRAVVLFLYAMTVGGNLRKPDICLNRINGLDIGEVETELTRSARWLNFSIILWIFMQCTAPLLELLPPTQLSYPPMDETTSTVFALDIASDNTSTLPHQAKTLRGLWPICHVASTVAHIYKLYPREQSAAAILSPLATPSWESQTLRRLQNLNDSSRSTPQDFSLLCHKVRHILAGAVEFFEARSYQNSQPQKLVLSAYHTLIIHLLFPSRYLRTGDGDVPITDGLIGDFCNSTKALLRVSPAVDCSLNESRGKMNLVGSNLDVSAEIFMLGLDACSRAFAYLQKSTLVSREAAFMSGQDKLLVLASGLRALLKRGDELANHASQLQGLAKCELLRRTKRSKAVKRQLKQVMQGFEYPEEPKVSSRTPSRRSSQDQCSPPSSTTMGRDAVPDLVHSNSTDSASSGTSLGSNPNFGNTSSCLSTDSFVAAAGIDQLLDSTYNLNDEDNLVGGYFDSLDFMPDVQDAGAKMSTDDFPSMYGDFTFSRGNAQNIYSRDLK